MDSLISLAIIFAIGYIVIKSTYSQHQTNKQKKQQDLQISQNTTGLTPIPASIILKRGEVAYYEDHSVYSEVRVERRRQSVFLWQSKSGRSKTGTFYGGSVGKSKPVDVLTEIDSGTLTLTNKRLYFDGGIRNKNIKLNSIMSIDIINNFFSADQKEISVENRSKSLYFSTSNPRTLRKMITIAI